MKPNPCGCQMVRISYGIYEIRYCVLHEEAPSLKEALIEIAFLMESGSKDTQTVLRLANTALAKLGR